VRAGDHHALTPGSRGSVSSIRNGTRAVLVIGQVSVAVVLVVAAGLLMRTFANLLREPVGIRTDHVLTMRLSPPPANYQSQADINRYFDAVLDRLRGLPGVRSAGASTGLPLAYRSGDWSFDIEGQPVAPGKRHNGAADWYTITPGYFESLQVPLRAGRLPAASDRTGAGDPAIFLNETAAGRFFADGRAVGHRLKLSGSDQPWRTIAGVVGDVRHRELDTPAGPEMFIPLAQFKHFSVTGQARGLTVVVRSDPAPLSLVPAVRAALRAVDDSVPPAAIRDMETVFSASLASRRLTMVLMGAFGALALILAAIGIYGVMAYQVVQRTRELGVRLALGASPDSVRRLVVYDGMRLVAIGVACGALASLALAQFVSHLLFGVGARDLTTLAGSAVLLGAVGFVAALVPALRATRVDPMIALRAE
jgi:putative ABC transport system permease protein